MKKLYFLYAATAQQCLKRNWLFTAFLFVFICLQSYAQQTETSSSCSIIDFEQHKPGLTSASSTSKGTVAIHAKKRNEDGSYANGNYASIFNTLTPSGGDSDLYTEDWGNALIINQDLGTEPNDNAWGGEITLDFSAFGPVTMTSLKALDFDVYEGSSWVYLYGEAGNELYKVQIQNLGNMSQQTVDLGNTKGVMKMRVVLDGLNAAGALAGSGAIDDIRFCVEETTAVDANAGADQQLTCAVTAVTLSGSSTTPGATYMWSGPNGFTSDVANPSVSVAGVYTLTATDPVTGATASDQVEVTQDTQAPFVEFFRDPGHDYFTCNNNIVVLWASVDRVPIGEATFEWTGPNGFTANTAEIKVSVVGTYTVTVTNRVTGCQTTASTRAWEFYPDVTVSAGPDQELNCKNPAVTLQGSVTGAPAFIHWYNEQMEHLHFGPTLVVDKPGKYVMQVPETMSGCLFTDTVEVTLGKVAPNITAQGGTLSETGTVQLMGSSTTDGVTYSWTGPEGYTSTEQNPVVSEAGEYTLTVTDQNNGCTATATVLVEVQAVASTESISQVQAYPNPVKERSKIEFKLKNSEAYVVNLYDLKGNLVSQLGKGHAKAGKLVQVELENRDLQNGLYVAHIQSASDTKTIKLILKK